jgi:hypothetical protein
MARELGNLHIKVGANHKAIKTHHLAQYSDGFSFCVDSELKAFQAAYLYQGNRTKVQPAAPGYGWLVQIYKANNTPE